MSETLCTLRTKGGGGGKYTETSLWTNPSPSSTFDAQTVTLSDSIDNYKYIAIRYKFTAGTSDADYTTHIVSPSDIAKSIPTSGINTDTVTLGGKTRANYNYSRIVHYVSSTSLSFTIGYGTNFAGTSNNIAIPLEILGLNELVHAKGFDESVLWTNNAPTTARSGTNTITLSESYQNYDFVKITYSYTTTDTTSNNMTILVAPTDLYGVNGRPTIALSRINASGDYVQVRHISSNSYTTITDTLDVSAQSTSCIILSVIGCKFK